MMECAVRLVFEVKDQYPLQRTAIVSRAIKNAREPKDMTVDCPDVGTGIIKYNPTNGLTKVDINTVNWRNLTQQPSSIITILLLILLLAFRVHACSMPSGTDSVLLSAHGCCQATAAVPDIPATPTHESCHDGACLQVLGEYSRVDLYGSFANGLDGLVPVTVTGLLPPDWSGQRYSSHRFIAAIEPMPLQRFRILRL